MCQTPTVETVKGMLGPAVPADVTIKKIQSVPSLQPKSIYQAALSDGRTAAVAWIKETITRQSTTERQDERPPSSNSDRITRPPEVLALLPTLLHHGQPTDGSKTPFAAYLAVQGTPLSLLGRPPTPSSQRAIDRQLGALFRSLAHLTSPTGRFGPLAAVLGTATTTGRPPEETTAGAAPAKTSPKLMLQGGLSATGGAGTWSVAFHSMLESALRDGEDMAVVMAYSTIRRQFRRVGYLLEEVTVGRLVVVEGGERANILVSEERAGGDAAEEQEPQGDSERQEGRAGKGGAKDEREDGKSGKDPHIKDGRESEEPQKEADTQPRLRLCGLRDWSSCVFGDPLLATVFSGAQQQHEPGRPSSSSSRRQRPRAAAAAHARPPPFFFPLDKSVVEDNNGTAWVRLLLYQAYHAVVRIVSEFYRPRQDSSARELEARRTLNEVLARLAEVPDDAARRKHPRPSGGEMSPAKRVKAADG
ncbi:73bc9b13-4abe-4877-aa11-0b7b5ded7c73 [Thermothielavioides terrestris]|uniref:73bc9b13-4abe-4877-aa11-0b7b5ded7c73 n=1 Tax=Thermothielavioides terrestris TaxID=2587410 RepID=A0A3S4F331_9PEZI|nr:73bc9b13-4abe-4877-aa11-0b7b5ded7c73 [Thermothielavioides terrestris]